jgi:hypothetical protein
MTVLGSVNIMYIIKSKTNYDLYLLLKYLLKYGRLTKLRFILMLMSP